MVVSVARVLLERLVLEAYAFQAVRPTALVKNADRMAAEQPAACVVQLSSV